MPLATALMVGGGLLSGAGMLGQARAGRRAARSMNRLAAGVQGQYDKALAPIGGLLNELAGQNLRQMAAQDATMAGYGFDRGTREAEFARRTGGLNSYAAAMGVEEIRQQAALGQAALGALSSRTEQNLAARMGLTETMAQGQMRAADTANQIRLGGIQQRQQGAQQAWGQLGQLGGFAFGAGAQMQMNQPDATSGGGPMPPTSTRLNAPINMRGPAVLNQVGRAALPDFSGLPPTAAGAALRARNTVNGFSSGPFDLANYNQVWR